MPPLIPTTSPVAIATARILAAYLSNHRLSPAEAASLSTKIAETLVSLTGGANAVTPRPAFGEEPAAKRPVKPRRAQQARMAPIKAASVAEPQAAPIAESITEPDPEPVVAEAEAADRDPEDTATSSPEPIPEPEPEPEVEPEGEAQAGAAGVEEEPRKRKRPSRPRSRRGKGAGAAPASDTTLAEESGDEAPETEVTAGQTETEAMPEVAVAEAAAEHSAAVAKPRRMTSRSRRVATS